MVISYVKCLAPGRGGKKASRNPLPQTVLFVLLIISLCFPLNYAMQQGVQLDASTEA